MKSPLSIAIIVLFVFSFAMPFLGEIYFLKAEVFSILIIYGGLNAFAISWHWYFPIFTSKSNNDRLKEFKKNIYMYPRIIVNGVPKFTLIDDLNNLQDINKSISELCLSGVHFGIAALGFGGQAMLWLGDFSILTSGVYGAPLKFPLGRAFFSLLSMYLFILGSSVFFWVFWHRFFYGDLNDLCIFQWWRRRYPSYATSIWYFGECRKAN